MKRLFKPLLLSLLTSSQVFAAAVIFSGNDVKTLKSNIDLNGQSKILSGTVDPSSSATNAPRGSLYLNTSSGTVYRKTDTGSSTNWVSVSASSTATKTIQSKTSAYTILSTDDVVFGDSSGGTFAFTMPAASGNSGKEIVTQKTDSSLTAITVNYDATSTTLNTQNESITWLSDGSNWKMLRRDIPSAWTSYTPTFTSFGSPTSITAEWKRDGADLIWRFNFTTPGSGLLNAEARVSLPSGLTTASSLPTLSKCGDGAQAGTGGDNFSLLCEPSVTYATFGVGWASAAEFSKQNASVSFATSRAHSFTGRVRIQGWNN